METQKYSNRILIVEDDDAIRRVLSTGARINRLEADLAEDGLKAKEFISNLMAQDPKEGQSYPIILTDLRMPGMNGIELLNYVGEQVGAKQILKPEIFVLSGYIPNKGTKLGKFEEVLELGEHRYHQKPVDIINLFSAIKKEYTRVVQSSK